MEAPSYLGAPVYQLSKITITGTTEIPHAALTRVRFNPAGKVPQQAENAKEHQNYRVLRCQFGETGLAWSAMRQTVDRFAAKIGKEFFADAVGHA